MQTSAWPWLDRNVQIGASDWSNTSASVSIGALAPAPTITSAEGHHDLSAAITAEDEADVASVFEQSLASSDNHLRSFQRQV